MRPLDTLSVTFRPSGARVSSLPVPPDARCDDVPPGWYEDPYGNDSERYHDGVGWTERTRVSGVCDPTFPVAPTRPRPFWLRVIAFGAMAAAIGFVQNAIDDLPRPWSYLVASACLGLPIALIAPRVSYRRRDALWALFPVAAYFVLVSFGWRLTYLPYRNWLPRPDEADGWVRVTHPSVGQSLFLTRARFEELRAHGSGS